MSFDSFSNLTIWTDCFYLWLRCSFLFMNVLKTYLIFQGKKNIFFLLIVDGGVYVYNHTHIYIYMYICMYIKVFCNQIFILHPNQKYQLSWVSFTFYFSLDHRSKELEMGKIYQFMHFKPWRQTQDCCLHYILCATYSHYKSLKWQSLNISLGNLLHNLKSITGK